VPAVSRAAALVTVRSVRPPVGLRLSAPELGLSALEL
jgi:hypothetical protein